MPAACRILDASTSELSAHRSEQANKPREPCRSCYGPLKRPCGLLVGLSPCAQFTSTGTGCRSCILTGMGSRRGSRTSWSPRGVRYPPPPHLRSFTTFPTRTRLRFFDSIHARWVCAATTWHGDGGHATTTYQSNTPARLAFVTGQSHPHRRAA